MSKISDLKADIFILDLEDAVAPDAKLEARRNVCEYVSAHPNHKRQIFIRVNSSDSLWGQEDAQAAAQAGPDAVVLPKVSSAKDLLEMDAVLRASDTAQRTRLWAMIETPLGLLNLREIVACSEQLKHRLAGLMIGVNDLAKETGASLEDQRFAVLPWLSSCVLMAKAYGLAVLDGVYNNFKDMEAFDAECQQGKALGMDGKTLIHPSQIDICNSVFGPSDQDVEEAQKVIAAFQCPENQGKGVIALGGQMVELLHLERARKILAYKTVIMELENE